MPMSVTYVTVHGKLREETRGGVTTRYLGDTLGNVIKTTDDSGNVTSETTYWPFGEVRTQTGTNPSPWGFCGVWGYLTDAVSRMYVRARHYRADTSRWLTVDHYWPFEQPFQYCSNRPVQYVDYLGLASSTPRNSKKKQCGIYKCSVGLHQFICVDIDRPDGTSRNCSAGLYPEGGPRPIGPGEIGDRNYDCTNFGDITCELIIRSDDYRVCEYADAVCKCIDAAKPGQYNVINRNCYQFVDWILDCACNEFRYAGGWIGNWCRERTGHRPVIT
ncbi:hypothetical protein CCB81_09170 [Armatimonadetes bacterium Uphvl-Ar2]|nr:hypothetical protein CCB81_09170 [Armatimonadetes bacterium Uphvl-Ar2]